MGLKFENHRQIYKIEREMNFKKLRKLRISTGSKKALEKEKKRKNVNERMIVDHTDHTDHTETQIEKKLKAFLISIHYNKYCL